MKPYPEYKDTALPWLPKIPKHWECAKLRNLLSVVSIKNQPDKPLLSVVRERGVIQRNVNSKEENHNYIPEDLRNYKLVKKGQFAMNKMKAWQGSYGISLFDGIVSPAYFVFKLHGVSSCFFNIAIRSKAYIPFFGQASDGIRVGQWDLSLPRMREIPFFIPSSAEQAQIVRYLDAMTAKINKLIRAKKKQIALLQEQKQAIINQAVTKGLDPNVEMKDSGIDWLGQIPKHWTMRTVKSISDILPGYAFASDVFSKQGKYLLLRGINIGVSRINKEEAVYWNKEITNITHFLLQEDDLVLGLDRPWISGGLRISLITLTDLPCLLVQRVCRIRTNGDCFNKFLLYALRSNIFLNTLSSVTSGISVPHISTSQVGSVKIPLPSPAEQNEIITFIEPQLDHIEGRINKVQDSIFLIKEYTNSLVSKIITGQLDIRNITIKSVAPDDLAVEELDDFESDDAESQFTIEREE